jgi:hypothetical protein
MERLREFVAYLRAVCGHHCNRTNFGHMFEFLHLLQAQTRYLLNMLMVFVVKWLCVSKQGLREINCCFAHCL